MTSPCHLQSWILPCCVTPGKAHAWLSRQECLKGRRRHQPVSVSAAFWTSAECDFRPGHKHAAAAAAPLLFDHLLDCEDTHTRGPANLQHRLPGTRTIRKGSEALHNPQRPRPLLDPQRPHDTITVPFSSCCAGGVCHTAGGDCYNSPALREGGNVST